MEIALKSEQFKHSSRHYLNAVNGRKSITPSVYSRSVEREIVNSSGLKVFITVGKETTQRNQHRFSDHIAEHLHSVLRGDLQLLVGCYF